MYLELGDFSKMNKNGETIRITLSKSQAIVLFEWLTNCDESDSFEFDHEAEQRVVWKMQAQLETTLTEPFLVDYLSILQQARDEVATE